MDNTTHYEHSQPGTALLVCIVSIAVLSSVLSPQLFALVPLSILVVVAILFYSLTIRVTNTHIFWYFGPKFWKKSLPIDDIRAVEIIRTRWYYGLGIRLLPSGWLYTVSGLTAIKLTCKSNTVIMLGSDDAETLQTVLRAKLKHS